MPLTNQQKSKVRKALEANAAKQSSGLRDQMAHEQKRDAAAYELMQAARKDKKPLSWGDAQAQAEKDMKATKEKPAAEDKKPKPLPPQVG